MADFSKFAQAVARRLDELSKHELFVVDISGDTMWNMYLAAFPEGSNPIYRERTGHDCSCCRNFVKNFGNVVAVIDGRRRSIWEVDGLEDPYAIVAARLDELVVSQPIVELFRASEPKYGAVHTLETLADGSVHKWHHFYGTVAARHYSKERDKVRGDYRTTVEVFKRGLTEITQEALDTVVDLVESKALYRGEEFLPAVVGFRQVQRKFNEANSAGDFVWVNAASPYARFRNTAIGTLLTDLSSGMDVEAAVKSFETKVAPENYKRPTAIITPRMVEDAMATIRELGLETALERRFARMSDITINNVLWADSSVKGKMRDGIEALLMDSATTRTKIDSDKAEEITVDEFMTTVLPTVSAMEVLFKNAHAGNLMSLTAPVHADVAQLFKWSNNFGWSYNGNIADSAMRQAVLARGGRVDGVFRFTHSWNHPGRRNGSLMDLHVFMPGHGEHGEGHHDDYGNAQRVGWNHRTHAKSGGVQDVDYTTIAPVDYIPVENITFPDLARMPEGKYVCKVHNWSLRTPTEGGFKAEIEFAGQLFEYDYPKPLKHKEWVPVAEVELHRGVFTIKHLLPCQSSSQDLWGIKSETLVKVNTVMLSPNHWDDNAVGNKHVFFVLDGCKTDEPMRGIYNEFLRGDLEKHRKVFEVLGSKTKCVPTEDQLSGLGFSSTRGDKVTVAVTTQRGRRLYNINF